MRNILIKEKLQCLPLYYIQIYTHILHDKKSIKNSLYVNSGVCSSSIRRNYKVRI